MSEITQHILLDPPSNITHSFFGLGNIIELKWATVEHAYGYAIEKYIPSEESYVIIGVTRKNSFLDYSNKNFSTDDSTSTLRYRVATIGGEFEPYDRSSDIYYVNLPKLDSFYLNLVERVEANSNAVAVDGYKEEKLVVEEDNALQLYKLSILSPETDNNSTELNLTTNVYGPIKNSYSMNDNLGFFLHFANNTIVKFDQNNLFPIYTLPTLNKSISSVKIGKYDNLICCLETVFDQTQITIYDVTDNVVRTNILPIVLYSHTGERLNVINFEIVGEDKIFVLDENVSLRIFEIDFVSRLVTEVVAYNPILEESNKKSFLNRKIMRLRSEIVEVLKLSKMFTNEEKVLIESISLSENSAMDSIMQDYLNKYTESIVIDMTIQDQGILLNSYFLDLFDIIKSNENLRNINSTSLDDFELEFFDSERFEFYKNSLYYNGPYLFDLDANIRSNTHLLHSDLSNHMIIWSSYFVYFVDVTSLQFHNAIDCLTPKNKITNYLFEDFYPESLDGTYEDFDVMKNTEIDKIIKNVSLDKGFRSLAIEFEEISSMPIFDDFTNTISYDFTFSNRYVDIYKLDANDVFGKEIMGLEEGSFDFSHLKGFGYPLIYNYPAPNNNLLNESFYFFEGKCYLSTKTKLFYERTQVSVTNQLLEDVADGTLILQQGELYDIIHFNTRVNLTSNKASYNSSRYFSMFGTENDFATVIGADLIDQNLSFLDGSVLFTSNAYKGIDLSIDFDRFGESCLITNHGDEPDNNSRKTVICVYVGQELFPYSESILLPKVIFTRQSYPGTFSRKVIACDDKNMFLRAYRDPQGETYVLYFSPLFDEFPFLTLDNIRKMKINSLDAFYNTISAVFIERADLDIELPPALILYNDQRVSNDLTMDFYAHKSDSVWRWDIDYTALLESDYLGFRVSMDNKPWQYLPKNARSIQTNVDGGDGSYVFNIQIQYKDGSWSESLIANYHLKTSPPNKPILLNIQTDNSDRGKPILTWDRSPDHYKYEIIYNDSIFYSTFENFHSPEESFTNYTDNIVNIPIRIRSYDLHGNSSGYSEWSFVVSSYTKDPVDIVYEKYTNNVNPLISWSPRSGEFISYYEYKFDNFNFVQTTDLSCRPDVDLEEGVHLFELIGYDSLGNSTDSLIKYFEIKKELDEVPQLLQETIDRTLNCKKEDLWFNVDYRDATNSFIYSFDNFVTFYSFDNYTLDLRESDLGSGYHTIQIKMIDRYGNTSDALEYTFKIIETNKISPVFDQVDSITSNPRPIWSWKVMSDHPYSSGSLVLNEIVIDTFELKTVSSYQPKTNLGDGVYKLFVNSSDDKGNTSSLTSYEIIIDSTIPDSPTMSKSSIIDTNCLFDFIKNDEKIYGSLIEFNEKDTTKFFHESKDGNFLFNNLKENTNYILEVYNVSENSKKSKSVFYSFSTNQKEKGVTKVITLPNGAIINYNMSNGTYSLNKFGSLTNDRIKINNENFELENITIDSTVDSFSYGALSNDVIRLQGSIFEE